MKSEQTSLDLVHLTVLEMLPIKMQGTESGTFCLSYICSTRQHPPVPFYPHTQAAT